MTIQAEKPIMTAGISNIVLKETPAKVSFLCPTSDLAYIQTITNLLDIYKVPHGITPFTTGKTRIESFNEVNPKIVLQLWRNFGHTLRLHIHSNWKYLFFEIDSKDIDSVNYVIEVYDSLSLPLYYHETQRGYHFFSIKPILNYQWANAVRKLEILNPKYPPITLRVNANKYPNEIEYFKKGNIITPNGKQHHDTEYFRKYIEEQNFNKLRENYYLVWYSLDNGIANLEDKWSLTDNDL